MLIEFIFGAERSLMEEKQLKGEEGGGKGEYQQAVVVGTASKKREPGRNTSKLYFYQQQAKR